MTNTTENPPTEPERGLLCVVRHPDAGGQCEHPATMRVYDLNFCREHGEELSRELQTAEYRRALVRAYPGASEKAKANVRDWELDEGPKRGDVLRSLLSSLRTLRKLMRVAHEDGQLWVVENLELERESVAAQAAYALRDRAEDLPAE